MARTISDSNPATKGSLPYRLLRGIWRRTVRPLLSAGNWFVQMYDNRGGREATRSRRIAAQADAVLKRLKQLKTTHPGRKLVGILLTEHFGDIVACEPVVPWLRTRHAGDLIVWITRPVYAGLLKEHPLLDAVVEADSISACGVIIRSGVLDRVVDLHLHRKPCTDFGGEHKKEWGNPGVDTENYYHQGTLLEAMSIGAGLPPLDGQPFLSLPPGETGKVGGLNLPPLFIAIHAISNEVSRNWNPERWNQLAAQITSRFGLPVVEIGFVPVLSDQDNDIPSRNNSMESLRLNLCGRLSLVETAEVIRRAAYFIGVDSGPAHLANAFKIPSVILTGQYRDFKHYMPYTGYLRDHAGEMVIQWDDPAAGIPVDEVLRRFEAVRGLFPANNAAPQTTPGLTGQQD